MITSYEVGAVFKIVDQASTQLKAISAQFKELDALILRTKENMSAFGIKGLGRLSNQIKAVNEQMAALAGSSDKAALGAMGGFARLDGAVDASIQRVRALKTEMASIGRAGMLPGPGGGGGGGGRRNMRYGSSGSAGGHGGSVSMSHSLPGGARVSESGAANVAGWSILGGLAYGVYEEAKMQDKVAQILYHGHYEPNDKNKNFFRDIIQNSMSESGYGLEPIAEATLTQMRMFQGVPGNGVSVLPEMLRAATIEARLKGTSPQESMNSLIGLAHMTKEYDVEAIKKLAPAFAYLSSANPSSLGSMERAASYAVPILQSGMGIDPKEALLLGTALTRAGATNTKSGTWLRNMMLNAMPGTSLMSKIAFKKHEESLKALGLVDNNDKPTWYTDGKPDPFKMLEIASAKAADIPMEKRAAYEKQLFGVQGYGAFALLSDPAVRQQVMAMHAKMGSPEFKNQYATFMEMYSANSPMQKGRQSWADLNNVLMDIGGNLLPMVTAALGVFDSALKKLRETMGDGPAAGVAAGVLGIGAASMTKIGRTALAFGARAGAPLPFSAVALPAFAAGGLIDAIAFGAEKGEMVGAVPGVTGPFVDPGKAGSFGFGLPGKGPAGLPLPTSANLAAAAEAGKEVGEQSSKALKDGFAPNSFGQTGAAAANSLMQGFLGAIGAGGGAAINKMSLKGGSLVPPSRPAAPTQPIVLKVNQRVLATIAEDGITSRHSIPIGTNSHDGGAAYSPVDSVNI